MRDHSTARGCARTCSDQSRSHLELAHLLLVEAQDLQGVERGGAREGDVGLAGLEDLAEVDAYALERLSLRLVNRDGPGQDDGELRA